MPEQKPNRRNILKATGAVTAAASGVEHHPTRCEDAARISHNPSDSLAALWNDLRISESSLFGRSDR